MNKTQLWFTCNFYFNSRRDQKTGAPNPRVGACGNPVFGVATWRSERPAASKFAWNHETTKGRKDDTNIHVLKLRGAHAGGPFPLASINPQSGFVWMNEFRVPVPGILLGIVALWSHGTQIQMQKQIACLSKLWTCENRKSTEWTDCCKTNCEHQAATHLDSYHSNADAVCPCRGGVLCLEYTVVCI